MSASLITQQVSSSSGGHETHVNGEWLSYCRLQPPQKLWLVAVTHETVKSKINSPGLDIPAPHPSVAEEHTLQRVHCWQHKKEQTCPSGGHKHMIWCQGPVVRQRLTTWLAPEDIVCTALTLESRQTKTNHVSSQSCRKLGF